MKAIATKPGEPTNMVALSVEEQNQKDSEDLSFITERDLNDYRVKRELDYPSIGDQLDEIYRNGLESWKVIIKVTKDKYPKPV